MVYMCWLKMFDKKTSFGENTRFYNLETHYDMDRLGYVILSLLARRQQELFPANSRPIITTYDIGLDTMVVERVLLEQVYYPELVYNTRDHILNTEIEPLRVSLSEQVCV